MEVNCQNCKNFEPKEPALPPTPDPSDGLIPMPVGKPSFSIQLQGDLKRVDSEFFYVDMFETSAEKVDEIKSWGVEPVGYLSSQAESWRPDFHRFLESDLIAPLDGWEGEFWVDVTSMNVKRIMHERMVLAFNKGFRVVDLDNVDVYANLDSVPKSDCIKYVKFLSDTARGFGMRFSLKNAMLILPDVLEHVDFCLNEEGHSYNEMNLYDCFTGPLFNIEYSRSCPRNQYPNAYTILKKMSLKSWEEKCQ